MTALKSEVWVQKLHNSGDTTTLAIQSVDLHLRDAQLSGFPKNIITLTMPQNLQYLPTEELGPHLARLHSLSILQN